MFRERKLPMEEKKKLQNQDERVVEIELERLRGFVNHAELIRDNIDLDILLERYAELMENAFYNKENLNPQMKEQDEGSSTIRIIINLASKEYSKCIEKYLTPQDRYITIVFCELSGDKLVTKGTYAKMARGEMVRFRICI